MKSRNLLTWTLVLLLLLGTTISVAAQEDDPPPLMENPVATLLARYFESVEVEALTAYHEEGMGYGEMVKLLAIAQATAGECDGDEGCQVSLETLVAARREGMGMGQLFQEYGRPQLRGVGHVRRALEGTEEGETFRGRGGEDGPPGQDTDRDGDSRGLCNARERGGNAHARGQNVDCP